jgi:AcrR family transcriptional regulator
MRARFVDAAEAILSEVGEHGISARLIAQRAELKTQLLYYYFRTMDDLLRAVVQQVNERRAARFEEALAAPEPLRALWELMSDPSSAVLAAELSSIANHREAVRDEIVNAARDFRILQTKAVEALLPAQAGNDSPYGAGGVVMIAASLARMIVNETALGLTEGHAEALAIVEHMLARLRQDGAAQRATPPAP